MEARSCLEAEQGSHPRRAKDPMARGPGLTAVDNGAQSDPSESSSIRQLSSRDATRDSSIPMEVRWDQHPAGSASEGT